MPVLPCPGQKQSLHVLDDLGDCVPKYSVQMIDLTIQKMLKWGKLRN